MWPDLAGDCRWKLSLVLGFASSSSHSGRKTSGAYFFFQAAEMTVWYSLQRYGALTNQFVNAQTYPYLI